MNISAEKFLDTLSWVPDWWFLESEKNSVCKKLEASKGRAETLLSRRCFRLNLIIWGQLLLFSIAAVPALNDWWWSGKSISFSSLSICLVSLTVGIVGAVSVWETDIDISAEEQEVMDEIDWLFRYPYSRAVIYWPFETYISRVNMNRDLIKSSAECLRHIKRLAH